jgi:hypothetical protein
MTHDDTPMTVALAAWQERCGEAVRRCQGDLHRRVPHWVAIGARVWVDPTLSRARPERARGEQLVAAACREIEARENLVLLAMLSLLDQRGDAPWDRVLNDSTRLAGELLRRGCRDIEADVDRMAVYTTGIDRDVLLDEIAAAIDRISEVLLRVARPFW